MSEEVLKVVSPDEGPLYEFGPFVLDGARCLLRVDGELVELEPLVLRTLVVLVRAKGELVEKADLMREVWDGAVVTEHSLTRNIYRLRRTLSAGLGGRDCIRTVAKRGYCFTIPVTERRGRARTATSLPEIVPRPRRHVGRLLLASGLAVIVLAAIGMAFQRRPRPLAEKAGEWSGVLAFPAQQLRIIMDIRGEGPSLHARIDSLDQGVNGLAVTTIAQAGSDVTFTLAPASFAFRGKLEGDRIQGTFVQYGVEGTLLLNRQPSAAGGGLPGVWKGALQFPPRRFGCALHLKRLDGGALQAIVDFPDQGSFGLAVTMILQKGRELEFAVPLWGAYFHGEIENDGNTIRGRIDEPGMNGTLVLARLPEPDGTSASQQTVRAAGR